MSPPPPLPLPSSTPAPRWAPAAAQSPAQARPPPSAMAPPAPSRPSGAARAVVRPPVGRDDARHLLEAWPSPQGTAGARAARRPAPELRGRQRGPPVAVGSFGFVPPDRAPAGGSSSIAVAGGDPGHPGPAPPRSLPTAVPGSARCPRDSVGIFRMCLDTGHTSSPPGTGDRGRKVPLLPGATGRSCAKRSHPGRLAAPEHPK